MPAHNIQEFELWQPGYAGALVTVYVAGTTTPASLFTDEALTVAAANPQTLESLTDGEGVTYGKFATPLYTSSPYYLDIDGTEQTGVQRPGLTALAGENGSGMLVTATGGSQANSLANIVNRVVYATDYGALGAVAATNTATLNAAIGAAAGRNGSAVVIPNGTFPITTLSLSAGVVLVGQGRGSTILQSQTGSEIITMTGDRAGLRNLTLDGITQVASSVGVWGKNRAEIVLDDVEIKRFQTGIYFRGLTRAAFRDLYVSDCPTGAKLHGDVNAGGDSDGRPFVNNAWVGGRVQQCSTLGVELSYEDRLCANNTFVDVGFTDNTGTAVRINGARFSRFLSCWWDGNTGNFSVRDDTDTTTAARLLNTVIGLSIKGGSMEDGTFTIRDTAQDCTLESLSLANVDFTLTVPITGNLTLIDCTEDGAVTIAGDTVKLLRWAKTAAGASFGQTVGNTVTKAWAMTLDPGQIVALWVTVIGRRIDAAVLYAHTATVLVQRPGASLAYDTQTGNFTAGLVLTGQTSGATARIQADADGGTTGTLTLVDVSGTFVDNEIITDSSTGSATVNGTLTENAVASPLASNNVSLSNAATWGGATFVANGPEIEIRVQGPSGGTVEWTVDVDVKSN